MRQGAVAAVVILIVGLGAAVFTPIAAAVEARRVTPPGGVVAGEAVIVPAPGWTVQTQQTNAVLLTRAGAQMLVQWEAGTPPPPQQALAVLASATEQAVPDTRALGGVRPFTTPSGDPGYLQPFAAPGTTGAIAVVQSTTGQALVQAVAPSTTFSEVADDLISMITGLRIRRGGGS
jgi:predicted component of type VI protein secretion system